MANSQRKTLGIVFLTVFLDLVGFGLIIPIQPFFAETMGATPTQVTWLGAIFSLMTFLCAPLWGRLSDRVGRRPVMLVTILLTAFGYFLFGRAQTLGMLFFARLLSGVGSGNLGTAQAIIADSTPPEQRAKGMGIIGAAFGLGFMFGPALGGFLSQVSLSAPAYAAAVLSSLNFISAIFILPETFGPEKRASGTRRGHRALSLSALREACAVPDVGRIFVMYLAYATAFSCIEQVLGLFIEHHWLFDKIATGEAARPAARMTAEMLMLVGVTATVVQGGLIGRLVARFGERRVLQTGLVFLTISLLNVILIGRYGAFSGLLFNSVVMAAGTGLINPSLSSLLSRAVDAERQGGILGLGQACAALGRVIGPAVSGFLFSYAADLPFAIGVGLTAISVLIAFTIKIGGRRPVPAI